MQFKSEADEKHNKKVQTDKKNHEKPRPESTAADKNQYSFEDSVTKEDDTNPEVKDYGFEFRLINRKKFNSLTVYNEIIINQLTF